MASNDYEELINLVAPAAYSRGVSREHGYDKLLAEAVDTQLELIAEAALGGHTMASWNFGGDPEDLDSYSTTEDDARSIFKVRGYWFKNVDGKEYICW